MRKTSKILAVIGGILAILASFALFTAGALAKQITPDLLQDTDQQFTEMDETSDNFSYNSNIDESGWKFLSGLFAIGGNILIVMGAGLTLAGVAGIVSAFFIAKSNIASGVVMLISAFVCLLTSIGFFSFILLTLAGIFALVKDSSQDDELHNAADY